MKTSFVKISFWELFPQKSRQSILLLISFLLFLSFPAIAQQNAGWQASRETVDKLSKGQTEFNYEESKVPVYQLPDVLTSLKGVKITSKKAWLNVRRPEILELFTSQVYGRVPQTPYKQIIKVVKVDDHAMDGQATLKLIELTFTAKEKSLTLHLGLFTPNKAKKPVPAFLLICNRPTSNIDFSRVQKSEFWPAEEVIARGYAIAAFF